ncbi:CAP-associated domain-containing protein [Atopobacter phocae]|uniref:CAP-associated domain-containing protein n=1 Tax=Atopobacter phocae TaxID=136492 RepID=UPI000471E37D|nr:CAP-associated domain-containing protein [Atopobacter phocae]
MKRYISTYFIIVIVGLLVVYWMPLSLHNSSDTEIKDSSIEQKHEEITALPPALGFSQWINQSSDSFLGKFGEPNLKIEVNDKRKIWYYQIEESDQLIVQIDQNNVSSIIDLGHQINSGYFTGHMTTDHLKDELKVQSSFKVFDLNESDSRVFKLRKHESKYAPLFEFDNETFAITWFNQSKQLIGVYYLNKEQLYHSNLYEGAPTYVHKEYFKTKDSRDWTLLWNQIVNVSRTFEMKPEDNVQQNLLIDNQWLAQHGLETLNGHIKEHSDKLLTETEIRKVFNQNINSSSYHLMLTNQFESFGSWLHFVLKDQNRQQTFFEKGLYNQSALVQCGPHALWIFSNHLSDELIKEEVDDL